MSRQVGARSPWVWNAAESVREGEQVEGHKQKVCYLGTTMFWLRNPRNARILTLNLAFQVTLEIYRR